MIAMRAFTLLEVLITLSIIGILLVITIPIGTSYLEHAQDQVIQQQLMRDIHQALNKSQMHRVAFGLCFSQQQTKCDGTGPYQLLFQDLNEDGTINDAQLISCSTMSLHHGRLHLRSYPRYRHYLQFLSQGFKSNDNASIWYCREGRRLASWAVVLNQTGGMRILMPDKNGEIRDTQKKLLSCDHA